MERVYAGATWAPTFTVTTGGTFASDVWDARGKLLDSSVSESGGTATLTVASTAWRDGGPGLGRLEIRRTSGGVTTVEVSQRYRILPGLNADRIPTDYP